MRRRLLGADIPLVVYALLLTVYGILMVYSAGQAAGPNGTPVPSKAILWIKQLEWLVLALTCALIVSRVSLRVLEYLAWPVYLLATFLLVLTVTGFGSGVGTAEGTTSWLTIMGKRVGQPSELAKIAVVLMLAKVMSARKDVPASMLELWKPALIMIIPGLLILKQQDLGTALVFFGVFFAMLFWSGVKWQLLLFVASPALSLILASSTRLWGIWFILLTLLIISYRPLLVEGAAIMIANVSAGVAAQIVWDQLEGYRRDRLLSFINPGLDPQGAGYNVIQSMTAIGSGGFLGMGFNQGTQKGLSFVPEQETDFIFAVLGEELGFVGVCVALGLFLALFLRTTRIASRANDSFGGLVAFGLTSVWIVHVIVNVGMTLSLVPVTGIPLPFFSYGGSFLLACWLMVGILFRISVEGRGQPDSTAL
jgi:rod shape determining protein RodA